MLIHRFGFDFDILEVTVEMLVQMLLDTQAVKTILLDIPSLGRQVRPESQ